MKIDYLSDLHLDFHVPLIHNQDEWKKRTQEYIASLIKESKSGEVICLAGDFSHYNRQTLWTLETFSNFYEHVIFTYGNHDMYLVSNSQAKAYKNNSMNRIRELYSESKKICNVYPLFTDETFNYKGTVFAGNPMWYPLDTFEQQNFFNTVSNDSQLIKGVNMYKMYQKSIEEYHSIYAQQVDIMISHVPVIHLDSHSFYGSVHCYYTPVDKVNVKHWVIGHSHEIDVYHKSGINFYINCIGYPSDQLGAPKIKTFQVQGE